MKGLFSAASSQISKIKYFYFHNCIYQDLWKDIERSESISTVDFLKNTDKDYKLIIVGDAENGAIRTDMGKRCY